MSKLIIKAPSDYIKINSTITLIYGQPGSRKTTFAGTSPNPIMFDFDEGVHRLSKQYRIPYIPVDALRNWADVIEMLDDPALNAYDTFVFDTVTKLMDYLADYVVKQNVKNGKAGGGLSLQGYGALGEAFRSFVKKIKTMGKHIVFVAHDKEYKEGDATRLRPEITGSNLGVVTKDADLIGYMEIVNNEAVVQFTPTDRFYAKNSCGLEPQLRAAETTIAQIIERYEEGINSESIEMAAYKEVIDKVTADLSKCEDAIDLSGAYEKLKEYNHVLTSKVECWELFKQKAEELNLYFDKEKKAFLAKEEADENSATTAETSAENSETQNTEGGEQKTAENAQNPKPQNTENAQASEPILAADSKTQNTDKAAEEIPTVPSHPKSTPKRAAKK